VVRRFWNSQHVRVGDSLTIGKTTGDFVWSRERTWPPSASYKPAALLLAQSRHWHHSFALRATKWSLTSPTTTTKIAWMHGKVVFIRLEQ